MDKQEAGQVLAAKLTEYLKLSYAKLAAKIGDDDYLEVTGESGAKYQIEVQFIWDHKPGGEVLVSAGIDDGGLRVFAPLCQDFIVSPDGRFVGE